MIVSGTSIDALEIVALLSCIGFSGFFSGSEAMLMSIGSDRARQLVEAGGRKGRAMRFMLERPNELLSTILVGNNIVNVYAASLATTIAARIFKSDAIGISVGVTTVLILIFGEVLPKAFARNHAEKLSVFVIECLRLLYFLMFPIVKAMVLIIHTVLGKKAQLAARMVTTDDIEYMISKAEQQKSMDPQQIDLLNSILEFPTIKVKDIMVPRTKVKSIQVSASWEEVIQIVEEDVHSRYPVCDGDLDNIIGFLHVKDLAFTKDADKKNFNVRKITKAAFFVYEHMKIQAVFDHMNRKKVHLALIKDENGLVVGIITLEDIVEEILGDIQDEHDDEIIDDSEEDTLSREGVMVEGTISLRELYNDYDVKIPLNDNYSTLAGFILDMLGNNFPEEGQIIVWEGYSFVLERVADFEIKEVRVRDLEGDKHIYSKREASEAHSQSETTTPASNSETIAAK
jgi:putative hemolysin